MGIIKFPLHQVKLEIDLVSGLFRVGVCAQLPVIGVELILENDLAGGKVQ